MGAADMSPRVTEVADGSAGERCGVRRGDIIRAVDGTGLRDIIEWQRAVSSPRTILSVERAGAIVDLAVDPRPGEPFGVSLDSAVFDRIHTCDNHCEFCFIYQLPKGMRRSLYTKDDDYRLSFLFGNFTTLTRFTEADLERVIDERLGPLYVSIHVVRPRARSEMLRNTRGGTSLRWLGALLEAGIEVHGQIVLCPGVNDAGVLDDTLHGILERFDRLTTLAIVPLGLSRHNTETRMRVHTAQEARDVVHRVGLWQERFLRLTGRRVVHAADEFYLNAGLGLPEADEYGDFEMLEDGIGLARSFVEGFNGTRDDMRHHDGGFFRSVDESPYVRSPNPAAETSLRRQSAVAVTVAAPRRRTAHDRLRIVTGELGARVIEPLVVSMGDSRVDVVAVANEHFGGNTAVAGLLTYADIDRTLAGAPEETLHLIPDVCLNGNRFLDGHTVEDLSTGRSIEVLPASGTALRARIEQFLGGHR